MEMSFTFGPKDTPDTQEPLPYRIVAVAPFSADDQAPAKLMPLTKETFDGVLAAMIGKLVIEVPNHLHSAAKTLVVELPFAELNDLSPAVLIEMVEELKAAKMLVDAAKKLSTGEISTAEFEKQTAAAARLDRLQPAIDACMRGIGSAAASAATPPESAPKPAGESAPPPVPASGNILDMVDMPADPPVAEQAQSRLGSLISAIGKSGGASASGAVPAAAKGAELAQKALDAQLNEILHHDDFRSLERAWRSAQFLLDHTDFRQQPVRIDLLHATRESLIERLTASVVPAYESGAEDPPAVVVTDLDLANTAADLDLARMLAELGENIQAPVLVGISGRFVGKNSFAEMAKLRNPKNHFESDDYTQWQALREKEPARWLGVAANRFLLRAPYDANHRRGAGFSEAIETPESFLWGRPQWIVASLVAQSAAKTGWPTQITGTTNGAVSELPMVAVDADTQSPLEALLPEAHCDELAAAGFIALVAKPNRDAAYVLRCPSAKKPGHYGMDASANTKSTNMVALPYQLLAARLGEIVLRNKARIVGDSGPEAAAQALGKFAYHLIGGSGAGAKVSADVQPHPTDANRAIAVLTVMTGRDLLNNVEVHLGVPL